MKTHFSLDICQICLNRILISFISCLKVRPPPLHLTSSSNTFILPRKPPTFFFCCFSGNVSQKYVLECVCVSRFYRLVRPRLLLVRSSAQNIFTYNQSGMSIPRRNGEKWQKKHCSVLLLCSICLSDNNCY